MTIHAQAAMASKQSLKPFQYEPTALGPHDIEVAITHCGICHSDIHLIDNDWGVSSYPLVPGHEIIGTIVNAGGDVKHLKQGQRVGVGWQRGSCLVCEQCVKGDENLCPENRATCVGNHGGFAECIRTDGRFAFAIPDSLSSENAAPLLCGGATVYSPLKHYGVVPSMRVGVVGIGGLGHLALQFANAFGCEVTAFSSTPEKEKEARDFGAHRFVASASASDLKKATGSLDFILSTAFANLDWGAYLQLLRPNGKLCFVGVPSAPIHFHIGALLGGQKSVCASVIGSRNTIREMLDFAARHDIEAMTEVMPLADVNKAIEKVRANKARYRMVLGMPA
jgi:alcohol/geraniol dehydrogenase (NADP+)